MSDSTPTFAVKSETNTTYWIDADQPVSEIEHEMEEFGINSKQFKVLDYDDMPDIGPNPDIELLSQLGEGIGEFGSQYMAYVEWIGVRNASRDHFLNSRFSQSGFLSMEDMAKAFFNDWFQDEVRFHNKITNDFIEKFLDWKKFGQWVIANQLWEEQIDGTLFYFWRDV